MDGVRLKLEKIGQFFRVLALHVPKILKKKEKREEEERAWRGNGGKGEKTFVHRLCLPTLTPSPLDHLPPSQFLLASSSGHTPPAHRLFIEIEEGSYWSSVLLIA